MGLLDIVKCDASVNVDEVSLKMRSGFSRV